MELSDECENFTVDIGILFLALVSLVEGLCFLVNRQFALKLQDASFMDKLLRNTDSELEIEGSSETEISNEKEEILRFSLESSVN